MTETIVTADEIADYVKISKQIEALTKKQNDMKESFRKRIPLDTEYQSEGYKVYLTTATTINAEKLIYEFPPKDNPMLYKTVPDTTKVRAILGEDIESFLVQSTPRVNMKAIKS